VHSLFFQLFVLNCPVLSRNLEKIRALCFLSVSKSTKLDALTLARSVRIEAFVAQIMIL